MIYVGIIALAAIVVDAVVHAVIKKNDYIVVYRGVHNQKDK